MSALFSNSWGITIGTEAEPDGRTSEVLAQDGTTQTEIPAKKRISEITLVAIEKGDCDVYNSPDHATPYAAEVHGFR